VPLLVLAAGCAHAPGGRTSSDPAISDAAAASLLKRKCQSCHALPNPAAHTAAAWQAGIAKMRGRLVLTDGEWERLLALVPADSLGDSDK